MKNFIKRVDWKKFWEYNFVCFLIVLGLYFISLADGMNVFPENLYVVFLIPLLFAFLMLLKAGNKYAEEKAGIRYKKR